MSNEARKFRKHHNKVVAIVIRETGDTRLTGVHFQHPEKVGTPLVERNSFQQYSAKKQDGLAKARGIELTDAQKEKLATQRPVRAKHARSYAS